MKYAAYALLLLALAHGAWAAAAPPIFDARVAMVFADGKFVGSAYKAGGFVRSVWHLSDKEHIEAVGWPGQLSAATVKCRDKMTDSMTLESDPPLRNFGIGMPPILGESVTLLGWRKPAKEYILVEHTGVVFGYQLYAMAVEPGEVPHTFGPVMEVTFIGSSRGMSGGPVLYKGTAIATMNAFDGEHIYAVPIQSQRCP